MIHIYILIFCSLLMRNSLTATPPNPTANYANKKVLSEPDAYILYWNYTDQVT